jgi:type I site-specific restriction endonuclease
MTSGAYKYAFVAVSSPSHLLNTKRLRQVGRSGTFDAIWSKHQRLIRQYAALSEVKKRAGAPAATGRTATALRVDPPTHLAELERIFVEAGVDQTSLDVIIAHGGLGRFVRSLVGLDREAAKRAFAYFVGGRKLTADQLEFVALVIDYLTARGSMDPKLLYESPFTDFDRNGVEGVFAPEDVVRLPNGP